VPCAGTMMLSDLENLRCNEQAPVCFKVTLLVTLWWA
jgi:hypothetical protein